MATYRLKSFHRTGHAHRLVSLGNDLVTFKQLPFSQQFYGLRRMNKFRPRHLPNVARALTYPRARDDHHG